MGKLFQATWGHEQTQARDSDPAPALAQDSATPDISGTWILNLAKSKLGKGADVRSETVVITLSASNVAMHYTVNGKESNRAYSYVTDGKEHPFTEVQGGEDVVKAYWKKSALVIETIGRLKMPNSPDFDGSEGFHLKDRWTLSGDGRVLMEESDGGDHKTVSVYDKQ
jgi:hypothetical protein